MQGCPTYNSHCEWGVCECDENAPSRRDGHCYQEYENESFKKDWNKGCLGVGSGANSEIGSCTNLQSSSYTGFNDMNLVCNSNMTEVLGVQLGEDRCQCRPGMKFNEFANECQIFLDVDCSHISYESKPSQAILDAVETGKKRNIQIDTENRTETAQETLKNSLLSFIDIEHATKNEIKEAFCRDIDVFSFAVLVRNDPLF